MRDQPLVRDNELPAVKAMTVCCQLTPAGRGAIATIAVRGPQASAIVASVFQPLSNAPLTTYQPGQIVVGIFSSGASRGEELVVGLVAPDEIEIHCHGGLAATTAICDALQREGCEVITPAEWVNSAASDPFRAAARMALSQATTARTAAHLLDQFHGALSDAVSQIQRLKAAGDAVAAENAIRKLLHWADFGLHLTKPWRIVLAGQPNSGKSSLMNAIMGYQRSIVFDLPGTTRDVLLATTAIDGWPVELRDMAGLRAAADSLEAAGIERAWHEVATADLVLFVSDITARWDAALCQQVISMHPGGAPRVLIVHNKCDLAEAHGVDLPTGQRVSAARGDGIEALCRAAMQVLIPEVPPRASPIPFTDEQVTTLRALLTRGQSETP